jgi:hypothetical protein
MWDAGKNPRLPRNTANLDFLLAIISSSYFGHSPFRVAEQPWRNLPLPPGIRLRAFLNPVD